MAGSSNESVVKGQSGTFLFSLIDFGSLFVLLWHGQSLLWVLLLRITSPFKVFFWSPKMYLFWHILKHFLQFLYLLYLAPPTWTRTHWEWNQYLVLHDCNNLGRDPEELHSTINVHLDTTINFQCGPEVKRDSKHLASKLAFNSLVSVKIASFSLKSSEKLMMLSAISGTYIYDGEWTTDAWNI